MKNERAPAASLDPAGRIAGLLGMSQTQVAMGIYRARQKLMQMMKGGDRSGWNMTGS